MISDEQIDRFTSSLLEKMIAAKNDPTLGLQTCSKTDAAKRLGVNRATIYNMVADGRLRSTHDGKKILVKSLIEYERGEEQSIARVVQTNRIGNKKYV